MREQHLRWQEDFEGDWSSFLIFAAAHLRRPLRRSLHRFLRRPLRCPGVLFVFR